MSPDNEFTELYNLFFEKFSDDLIIFNRMKNCIEDKFETDEPSHYMVLPRKRKMLKAVLHNLEITEPLRQMKLVDRAMVLAFAESLDS